MSITLFFSCQQEESKALVPYYDEVNNKWGYMSKTTQKVYIEPKYDLTFPFISNRYAIVGNIGNTKTFDFGIIDTLGHSICAFENNNVKIKYNYLEIESRSDSSKYLLDFNLNEIIPKDSCYNDIIITSTDYFFVKKKNLWGCYNQKSKKEVYSCQFPHIENQINSISLFDDRQVIRFYLDSQLFYENNTTFDHPLLKASLTNWYKGCIAVYQIAPYADDILLVNKTGDIIYKGKSDGLALPYYHEGLISIGNKDRKFGVVDTLGQTIIPFTYDHLGSSFVNGLIKVSDKSGAEGVINKKNQIILPLSNENAITLYPDSTIRVTNTKLSTTKLINFDLESIIPFSVYNNIQYLKDNVYTVEKTINNTPRVGLANKNGETILIADNLFISNFSNGLVAIMDSTEKIGYADVNGNWIFPPQWHKSELNSIDFKSNYNYVKDFDLLNKDQIIVIDIKGDIYI